jgi:hypothetical protein
MANYESINRLEREIEEKEVAHRLKKASDQKRLNQMRSEFELTEKSRSIEILNAPLSLIPSLESHTIPYGTSFFEYKILNSVILSTEKKTVSLVLELDRVPDLPGLSSNLKLHEFVKVEHSDSPKQIRAEWARQTAARESQINEIVEEILSEMTDDRACCMCGNSGDGYVSPQFNGRLRACCSQNRTCIKELCELFGKKGVELDVAEMEQCLDCTQHW